MTDNCTIHICDFEIHYEELDFRECTHMILVDHVQTENGLIPVYKCEKGHRSCMNSFYICEEFIKGD